MGRSDFGTIIQIDNCLVSEEVVTEYFACDYEKCKGCCCVIGDSGAPLREDELEPIERNYPHYKDLMQEKGRELVARQGFFDIDRDGDLVTPTCAGTEECAYSCFDEEGNCFCAMERRWFQGKGDFRKPVSCWLYPIRITRLRSGMDALNFHRWNICKDAFEKGRKEGIRVYQFLREPLIELYGEDFYESLSAAARHINGD